MSFGNEYDTSLSPHDSIRIPTYPIATGNWTHF